MDYHLLPWIRSAGLPLPGSRNHANRMADFRTRSASGRNCIHPHLGSIEAMNYEIAYLSWLIISAIVLVWLNWDMNKRDL